MFENGQIIESPHGFSVVRLQIDPTYTSWLATDRYRGHFSDDEVRVWLQLPAGGDFAPGTLIDLDDDQITKRSDGTWHWIGLGRQAYLDDEQINGFVLQGIATVISY